MTKNLGNHFNKIKLYTTSLTSHYLNNVGNIFIYLCFFGRRVEVNVGFSGGSSGKESPCAGDMRTQVQSLVGEDPWRRT